MGCIHAALPPSRHQQKNLPGLARRLSALIHADHLPDRMDAWLSLNAWLSGGKLWDDVYIDSADVHGSATQRFAVLMDVLAANPPLAAALRRALRAIGGGKAAGGQRQRHQQKGAAAMLHGFKRRH